MTSPSDRQPIVYRYWWNTMPEKGKDWPLRAEFNELSDRSLSEQLTPIRCRGSLGEGEIAVISVLRNEASRLPLFFEHYKKLGATRFFMVDNNSYDGSHEILLDEPLADVFHTATPYKQGQMGVYWYNGLARAYCRNRWTVTADADELLVYDGMEDHDLRDLARLLAARQQDRLLAMLVDVYPSEALGHDSTSIAELLQFDCWFDDEGYTTYDTVAGRLLTGGPRHRLFNQGKEIHLHWLSKYPFILMSEDKTIFDAHYIWPYDEEVGHAPSGGLIHLKLLHDFIERSKRNEIEGQHVANSRAYRIINKKLAEDGRTTAFYSRSKRYRGPKSLIRHRLMKPLDWGRSLNREDAIAWRDWSANLPWDGGDWADRRAFERLSYRSTHEHLTAVRRVGDLRAGDVPLICVLRNEAARLPVFLNHYRTLGVTRFIMVDNNSDDGSHDILMSRKDTDVFFTRVPFREGQGGLYWANGLAHALCRGHWTVRADVDELLVYDGMDKHGLPQLARWLQRAGRDRIFAPMRDVYPSSRMDAGADIGAMIEQDCWFDSEGYVTEKWREGWHMTGGPRARIFGREYLNWLSKYPFFRMTKDVSIFNHHYLWPFDSLLDQAMGALLHLKLLGDFAERSKRYEREGQHAMGSRAYKIANSVIAGTGVVSAHYEGSRRYEGPRSFIQNGLMQSIDWDK